MARKNPGSSAVERLTPSKTSGPANAPDTANSYATIAPMLNPTTTFAWRSRASWDALRAYDSVLKSVGGVVPACPGSVAATSRVSASAGSAMTSAYNRALHIPPASRRTVRWAVAGPVSTVSQRTSVGWFAVAMAGRPSGSVAVVEDVEVDERRGTIGKRLLL